MAIVSTSCFESGGMRPLMMVSRLVTLCNDSWTSMHNCPAGKFKVDVALKILDANRFVSILMLQ